MNKNVFILLLIFVIPLFAYFMLSQRSASNVSVAESGKPQLIKFTSNMCGECKRVEPVVQEVMKNYQDSVQYIVIPVQVENSYNLQMMKKYNVTLVPTIIILDKNHNVVKRFEGYVTSKTLESYLRKICQ